MMKKTIIPPMVFLLILAAVPRASSARLKEEEPANSPIANSTIEAIELLTNIVTWLQYNMPSSQHYNETIGNLRKDISSLPSGTAVKGLKISDLLYKSEDRFNMASSVLNHAVNKLSNYCTDMLSTIETHENSEELLQFIATSYSRNLNFFNDVLKDAQTILMEIHDKLSASNVLVKEIIATRSSNPEKIIDTMPKEDIIQIIETKLKELKQPETTYIDTIRKDDIIQIILTKLKELKQPETTYINTDTDINIRNPAPKYYNAEDLLFRMNPQIKFDTQIILESDLNADLTIKTEKAQKSISALLSSVTIINGYIGRELQIVGHSQFNLETSLAREHISITKEHIELQLRSIKRRIVALKNACDSYSKNH